jgi:hypothetical protein
MPQLENSRHEKARQLRAGGKSQVDDYNEAFEVSNGINASRFFRRLEVRARVDELVRRRAVLAELDDAWVLRQLKAIAKNRELIGNANLNDYFVRNHVEQLIGIDLSNIPPQKIAALEEVAFEQVVERQGGDRQTTRRAKIKLRSAAAVIQANELIGRYLGLWKDKSPADAALTGKTVLEVYWKGSLEETPQPDEYSPSPDH